MALTTYAQLKSAVADYLDRSDLTSQIADCVTLAETCFNYGDEANGIIAIRHRLMETTTTTTPSDGEITLDADFLEMKRVTHVGDRRKPLSYISPDSLDELAPVTEAGEPSFYTIIGSTLITRSSDTSDISYTYYEKIPALSDSNTSNWLLSASPNAYLYGTLYHAQILLENPEAALAYLALTRNAMGGLRTSSAMNRSGPMAVRSATVAW